LRSIQGKPEGAKESLKVRVDPIKRGLSTINSLQRGKEPLRKNSLGGSTRGKKKSTREKRGSIPNYEGENPYTREGP